jgi:DNA-binding HxlR family transcriptional regulator
MDEGKANPASFQQGRRKKVAARPDAEVAEECSVQFAINLIQGKWKTRILSQLQRGPVRLSELRRMFPEASKKVLAQHLREMEKDGLVVRKDLSDRLRHVQYSLSDSMGFAVVDLISTLTEWGRATLAFKALPNPATGRPLAIPFEQRRAVCDEISRIERKGLSLGTAYKKVAKQYGVNTRTIRRIWEMRSGYDASSEVTIDQAQDFALGIIGDAVSNPPSNH